MSRVIPADQLAAYRRWELPDMDRPVTAPDPLGEAVDSAVFDSREERDGTETDSVTRLPTLEEIEAIQREAQEEGYAAGLAEGRQVGRQEGLASAAQDIADRVSTFGKLADSLSRPLAGLEAAVEEEMVLLATEIARHVVQREIATAPHLIIDVVRKAVDLLPAATPRVSLALHPTDASFVREALPPDGRERSWDIVEDLTLSRGGCRVDAEISRIDATMEHRFGTVIATILGRDSEPYPHGD